MFFAFFLFEILRRYQTQNKISSFLSHTILIAIRRLQVSMLIHFYITQHVMLLIIGCILFLSLHFKTRLFVLQFYKLLTWSRGKCVPIIIQSNKGESYRELKKIVQTKLCLYGSDIGTLELLAQIIYCPICLLYTSDAADE